MTVRVMVGDALSVLRTLPAESVQCVVTSPPYFGLRSYSTEPQVWGGDPEHGHVFQDRRYYAERGGLAGKSGEAFSQPGTENAARIKAARWVTDSVCPCGAWRGELGSEPNPGLFIEHLVSIFDEVWRVLRPDGLCFVNLGDSYSGSGKGSTGHNGIGDQGERQEFTGGRGKTSMKVLSGDPPDVANAQQRAGYVQGIPAKNLLLVPHRFAIAMQGRGWVVRSEIVWAKTSAMPESVRDRPTSAWEPIWMFSKSQRYFYDGDAVRQPHQDMNGRVVGGKFVGAGCISRPDYEPNTQGWNQGGMVHRNREYNPLGASLRNVWTLGPSPFADAHFATFPPEIPRRCILAGSRPGDTVLDPFLGSGTTAMVADRLGRDAIGIELNTEYAEMARKRIEQDAGTLFGDPVAVETTEQASLFGEMA